MGGADSEVFAARNAVGRFAVNVNQAVTVLHSTGQAPVWLADAVRLTAAATARLDAAADGCAACCPPLARGRARS